MLDLLDAGVLTSPKNYKEVEISFSGDPILRSSSNRIFRDINNLRLYVFPPTSPLKDSLVATILFLWFRKPKHLFSVPLYSTGDSKKGEIDRWTAGVATYHTQVKPYYNSEIMLNTPAIFWPEFPSVITSTISLVEHQAYQKLGIDV